MKNKSAYLVIVASILVVLLVVFSYRHININNNINNLESPSMLDSRQNNDHINRKTIDSGHGAQQEDSAQYEQKINHNDIENINEPGLNRFAFDMSRELCKQEREALEDVLASDSKLKPSAKDLINLLKKTANSKCSSFRKNNAQELFFKFNLDEKNYKKFLQDFTLVLWDYQGTMPLTLMRASIKELEHAKPDEVKPLRDAVLFALNNTINDSSAFIDIGVSLAILKELSEKGLVAHPTPTQITNLSDEFRAGMQAQIRRNDESRKNHDYPLDKMADYLDYEDAKIELKLIREEYETVDQFRARLSELMKKSFK